MAADYSSQFVDGENVELRGRKKWGTRRAKKVERQTKIFVLIPYFAAKTEYERNFCRKDESCDTESAI